MKFLFSSSIKLAITASVICLSISCSDNNTISGDDNTSEYVVLGRKSNNTNTD
ncbi:hypothetical protein BH23BAC3_BH23BAC3_06600 [soil metagenome]